jgi:hypothetical protein
LQADCCVLLACCRALAQLQQLDTCILGGRADPPSHLTPTFSTRPALRLKHLFISRRALSVFVMWTRLPSSSTLGSSPHIRVHPLSMDPETSVRFDVPSSIAASSGWLDVLLSHRLKVNFYISAPSDPACLVPHLQRYTRPLMLTLQCKVGPEALGALVAAYGGHSLAVIISRPPSAHVRSTPCVQRFMDTVKPGLADAHLDAMLSRATTSLKCLCISDCSALSSTAVEQALQRVGAGLLHLSLLGASNVTSFTLGMLLQPGCRGLRRIVLRGALGVQYCSIAALLLHMRPGFCAQLCGTGVDWGRLKACMEQQGGYCRIQHNGNVAHVFNSRV